MMNTSNAAPTSVIVVQPIGQVSFPRCVADCFTSDDTLTITSLDTDEPVRTFARDQWVEAVVFGVDWHVNYALCPEDLL